jgi:potassium efflux system protein
MTKMMNPFAMFLVSSAVLTAAIGDSAAVSRQQPENSKVELTDLGDPESTAPTLAELEGMLAALEADATIRDTLKPVLREKYEQAIESVKITTEFAATADEYRDAIRSGPERIVALRDRAQAPESSVGVQPVDAGATADTLRSELEALGAQLVALEEEKSRVVAELARIRDRSHSIVARTAGVESELSEIRPRLASFDKAADPSSPTTRADKLLLQARVARFEQELEMLREEQRSQPVREELLLARQALLARQIEDAETGVARVEATLGRRLAEQVDRIRSAVERVPESELRRSPEARTLTEEVEALAAELEGVVANARRASAARDDMDSWLDAILTEFAIVREQLEHGTGGRTMVQVLFELDRRCIDAPEVLQEISVPSVDDVRLASLRIRNRLRAVRDGERGSAPDASTTLAGLRAVRHEALEDLDRQYQILVRELARLEQGERNYLEQVRRVREYIAAQLFGFGLRSSPPLDLDTFASLPEAVAWEFRAEHGRELARGLASVATRRPFTSLGIVLLVVVLGAVRGRILRALEAIATHVRRTSTDRYGHTARAMLWTVLLAIPIPIVFGYVGWALAGLPSLSDWMWGLTAGLQRAAWILLAASLASAVVLPAGLGVAHFGWNSRTMDRLRAAIFRAAAVYIPAFVLTLSCSFRDASLYFDSLGRVSFLVAHLWVAFVLYRVLFPSWGRSARRDDGEPQSPVGRWRRFGALLLIAVPLAFVALLAAGYTITTIMLSLGLIVTLGLVGVGAVLYGLAMRWFVMRQRKFALGEAIDRRRAQREGLSVEATPAGSEEIVAVSTDVEEEPDLDAVGDQTRDLLRGMFGLGTLIAVLAYWSETFPVVDIANSVSIPGTGGLTVLKLAMTVLVVVATYVVVRNLPGLLELAIFRTTEIAPGTRHAIYTLVRYGTIALGASVALNIVQVDWAKFGWIAAALSVGLGFGLQEVVANFVCGLILLFERPIRVGDIVTIESMTGTVARIQMRATTITNWDRQEFVVPNKTLITSTLLNWTLSEPLNRVVVPVGVAYGSDTDRARSILLDVASDHPRVLDDPEPIATFEQFGDSSLNLVLRAYLPDMENRLATITELHTEIHRRFADAGIEIPFPQRDVHLRSGRDAPDGRDASQDEHVQSRTGTGDGS